MALKKIKLGDYLIPYKEQCGISNLTPYDISGINKDKEFFEPSRQTGENTSNYQNVPPQYFACNLMHVGRDKVLPIAYNHTQQVKRVSPAYSIFRLKENSDLLDYYFFLYLKSDERDRFFWFNTDASIRDGMSWDDLCNVEFNIPSPEIQQKYVNIYKAMVENQKSYERGLDDLKLTYEGLLNEYKHKASRKSIGNILQEVDCRNVKNKIIDVQGINIQKQFMPTVANTLDIDLSKYKIVHKGQFAFSGMQTGRDECIRIALFDEDNPVIISPAYTVLEPKDDSVCPEYLMVWFLRKETDRLGWFLSDTSIRTNLDLERFYEIEIPVPDINIQRDIANIYKVYLERKSINEKLKEQIKNICPILIKGSIEEAKKEA